MKKAKRHFKHCPQCTDPLVLRKGANKLSCNLCGWVDFQEGTDRIRLSSMSESQR